MRRSRKLPACEELQERVNENLRKVIFLGYGWEKEENLLRPEKECYPTIERHFSVLPLPSDRQRRKSMIEIRYVEAGDQEFWYSLDKHLPEEELEKKIRDRQGYVILVGQSRVGILRYNLFWDNTPFCTMLFVHENYRHRGYGKMLMLHWESEMKAKGYGMVLTSTQVDEDAQHFYRKLGYRDCGGFVIDVRGYAQPMEMIMIKEIR